jgi:hypothetical protein
MCIQNTYGRQNKNWSRKTVKIRSHPIALTKGGFWAIFGWYTFLSIEEKNNA